MARRPRVGFTLVELLVVITIIGMLMTLLLPAVNSVRESARRTTCANQMQQIAKAAFNYATNKDYFPGYTGNRAGPHRLPDASWFVAIAPQLEQAVIYDRWGTFIDMRQIPYIDLAVCPSDPPEQLTPTTADPLSHLSYVVNTGRPDGDTNGDRIPPDYEANGVFHDLRRLKAPKVGLNFKDGATNTLMLSENIQATKWTLLPSTRPYSEWTDEYEVGFVFVYAQGTLDANGEPNDERYRINGFKANSVEGETPRPSSNHPGGVNVAFCDGRTMFLRDDIRYAVYQQLMTPDGYHRNCDVPSTDAQGQPIPNTNKAYILSSADYTSQ